MNGKIKFFNSEKGFGFIIGDDNQDYFFHISQYQEKGDPTTQDLVTFDINENDKGLNASNVKRISDSKPIFLVFDDVRIKMNNIKNYGINYEVVEEDEEPYYEFAEAQKERLTKKIKETKNRIKKTYLQFLLSDLQDESTYYERKEDYQHRIQARNNGQIPKIYYKSEFLYVTTYQNDNYKFYSKSVSFDIHKKMEELDRLLT